MKLRFLLILLAALYLVGCSAVGSPGQTTVIVVTATSPAAAPAAQATNTVVNMPQTSAPGQGESTEQKTPEQQTEPAETAEPTTAGENNGTSEQAEPTKAPEGTETPEANNNSSVPATGPAAQLSIKQLTDYNVVDASGNPIGKVKDLVVNRAAGAVGQIPYVVVESSMNKDLLIPVPWSKIKLRPDLMAVMLPVTAAQLTNAPAFNGDLWPASFTAQQAALQGFWANPGQATAPSAQLQGAPDQEKMSTEYIRADDLLGTDLLSPQGVKLGEIKDIAVNWQNSQPGSAQAGQFGYAVLQLDDKINAAEPMIPIPWRLINTTPGQKNVIINLPLQLLQTAPNFAKGMLPNLYAEPLNSQLNTFWTGK